MMDRTTRTSCWFAESEVTFFARDWPKFVEVDFRMWVSFTFGRASRDVMNDVDVNSFSAVLVVEAEVSVEKVVVETVVGASVVEVLVELMSCCMFSFKCRV